MNSRRAWSCGVECALWSCTLAESRVLQNAALLSRKGRLGELPGNEQRKVDAQCGTNCFVGSQPRLKMQTKRVATSNVLVHGVAGYDPDVVRIYRAAVCILCRMAAWPYRSYTLGTVGIHRIEAAWNLCVNGVGLYN